MLFVNEKKESLGIVLEWLQLLWLVLLEFGWKPVGTTPVNPNSVDRWQGSNASYLRDGARMADDDTWDAGAAARRAWLALRAGASGSTPDQWDRRLFIDPQRPAQAFSGFRPLDALRRGGPELQGLLWAIGEMLTRGPVKIVLKDPASHTAEATIRMTGGMNWKGKELGAGQVVTLPIHECGYLLAMSKAEEVTGAAVAA